MERLVVVGLGYVGLPLVQSACAAGMDVVGLDVSPQVVDALNAGKSHVDDLSDKDVSALLSTGFVATTDARVVADAHDIVICVPTPLAEGGGPDLTAVRSACESISPHLKSGALVVLESTTYPGTTAEFVVPLLEVGSGLVSGETLLVAYSPERIDPGNHAFGLRNTPKVVGADSIEARHRAVALYEHVVDTVVVARGTREAESAKLLENTYRHVNIALVNEMAKFFHELEIDFWDVLDLAETKPFGFQRFNPGPGVGGHCIPIDPNYLSHRVRTELGYPFRFVELAQEINAGMPAYVVSRAMRLLNDVGTAVRGSRILLLGVTYKPNIADQRETPAVALAAELLRLGASTYYFDPNVTNWDHAEAIEELTPEALTEMDLVILVQNHSVFDLNLIQSHSRVILDTRGVVSAENVERL